MSSPTQRQTPAPWARAALHLGVALALAACSTFGGDRADRDRGERLGSVVARLPDVSLPNSVAAPPAREDVMAAYAAVHGRLPDPDANRAVGKRLADLAMDIAEERDAEGGARPYADAIRRYEALLAEPAGPDRDQILYQLARAYDLAGDGPRALAQLDRLIAQHPDSAYRVEAHFRRAEAAFAADRYLDAERDYQVVIEHGNRSPYWQNALYMGGWARFKAGDPDGALGNFLDVVDRLVPPGDDAVPAEQAELLADTLRAITLSLGDLEGPATLAAAMHRRGQPAWQYRVYRAVADDHLERERYLDSVATWQTFIDAQPLDPRAPAAQQGMIATLTNADFPELAREQRSKFVAAYGVRSRFWSVHDAAVRAAYLPALKDYLEDLAQTGHALAQENRDAAAFAGAARWYEELIETFGADPDVPRYLFLLGELHTEAAQPELAVRAYQRVMHDHPGDTRAPEAGYAAILALEKLAAGDEAAWVEPLIDTQLEFTTLFPADPRAPAVGAAAADGLFARGEFGAALAEAEALLADYPSIDPALRSNTLAVVAHSRFELGLFDTAESAYRRLLDEPLNDELRATVQERLLAAVYRQAEASEASGATDEAVAHYLRLADVAPGHELAVQGRFDAVAVLEQDDRTADAARLLDDFRNRHAGHPLAAGAPARLARLYEQTGDRTRAAAAYLDVAESDVDPERRRLARYRAAELELEAGNTAAAASQFARYVELHARPFDLHLEALDQLDTLAQRSGAGDERRRWLRAKIALEREVAGAAVDPAIGDRAAYLAAAAQFELALQTRLAFDAVRLVNPLAESLQRKRRELTETLAAFEAVATYQVAEFSAASTFQIADVYAALSIALLESERPPGLSERELEEYDLLLEEQAYPFEEQAIALHEVNLRRSWEGAWDIWVERSFAELRRLVPARFDRPEQEIAYVESIH